ncbi:MAG TPA: NADH-ubiquinone oxidoreductase-F iron-sulfur binding region domain-containing protein [Blastocatellia bacterium]|nr:NADH-ubiquinone oxidoreductase-F iron-sulfur binding region domain-containing protein [Blastocatellia bacterium]
MRVTQNDNAAESFYHLAGQDLANTRCQGLACFVARNQNPQRSLEATSQCPRVYCLGKCYLAPSSALDDERPRVEVRSRVPIVLKRIAEGGTRSFSAYTRTGGYVALESALERDPQELVREIELSGLRGRGGAGFTTGKKWRAVRGETSPEKFVVANADEGDPGAYIDRFIIEDDPYALIEGMVIGGYAVGARKGYVYLRAEYPRARAVLEEAVAEARRHAVLGERILGTDFGFDIEIVIGHGSYVCGEETALLNSIEGRRPEVRARPPYPTSHGLWGKPTLVNNVETLASLAWIINNGGASYAALGTPTSNGTKVVSLNSLFNRPGLYEVEFGVSVRHIVEELGGGLKTGTIRGVIIGGPLAGIIPPSLLDTPFAFDELHAIGASVGHGGVVAFDQRTSIAELMHHVFDFGAFESCGKCTPCRLGTREIERMFWEAVQHSHAASRKRTELEQMTTALALTSLCGHGSGLAEFARSVLRYYQEELESCFA